MDISAEIAAIQAASQGSELRQPIVDALTTLNNGTLPAVTTSDAGKILKVGANGWEVGEKSGYVPAPTGTFSITQNGIYNITNYANVSVNVSGGGGSDLITGSVIFYAGTSAPIGYLACDGTVYNIADYTDLADFFNTNYGSANYWGGDGVTTFAVPDWRGEFFRAAGTNSRTGQGSGGVVGEHQDQTMQNRLAVQKDQNYIQLQGNTSGWLSVDDADAYETSDTHYWMVTTASQSGLDKNAPQRYAARPTNTSLLVCIKT